MTPVVHPVGHHAQLFWQPHGMVTALRDELILHEGSRYGDAGYRQGMQLLCYRKRPAGKRHLTGVPHRICCGYRRPDVAELTVDDLETGENAARSVSHHTFGFRTAGAPETGLSKFERQRPMR